MQSLDGPQGHTLDRCQRKQENSMATLHMHMHMHMHMPMHMRMHMLMHMPMHIHIGFYSREGVFR